MAGTNHEQAILDWVAGAKTEWRITHEVECGSILVYCTDDVCPDKVAEAMTAHLQMPAIVRKLEDPVSVPIPAH